MEINYYNKYLNLKFKILLNTWQNGIFSVNTLFISYMLCFRYFIAVLKSFENAFKEYIFRSYIIKDAVVDIRFLINIFKDNSILYKKY